jgi:triosephosphate isomerase
MTSPAQPTAISLRRRVVAVSLKMYLNLTQTQEWVTSVAHRARVGLPAGLDLVVIPDFISLPGARAALSGTRVLLGAQDVFWEDRGPFTGEISAPMLVEAGCRVVEIGHAERRRLFGETDEVVARKIQAAVRSNLIPLLCVGEPKRGDERTAAEFCLRQLDSAISAIRADTPLIVAYEPVWAIGAVEPAPVTFIVNVAESLKMRLARRADTRLIYGGSARPGLLPRLGTCVDGVFLGRFGHDPRQLDVLLREANCDHGCL